MNSFDLDNICREIARRDARIAAASVQATNAGNSLVALVRIRNGWGK